MTDEGQERMKDMESERVMELEEGEGKEKPEEYGFELCSLWKGYGGESD